MDSANAKTFYFAACFFFSLCTNLLCFHMKVSFFLSLALTGFSFLFPVVENWTAW